MAQEKQMGKRRGGLGHNQRIANKQARNQTGGDPEGRTVPALGVVHFPPPRVEGQQGDQQATSEQETRLVVCNTEGTLITKYTNSKTQVIRLVVLKESLETPQSPPVSFKPA